MISKTGMHVTLALAYLAKLPPGEYAGASFVAKQIGAPGNYLGKLFYSDDDHKVHHLFVKSILGH